MLNLIRLAYFCLSAILCSKKKRPQQITKAMQKLGPSFIKLGQSLAVRPDIVGQDVADALVSLQDKLPPFKFAIAKKIIEKELGNDINNIFKEFSPEPVAAASVAQVYKALTHNDETVAVKLLRPQIAKSFARDLRLFYRIASLLSHFKRLQRLRLVEIIEVLENSTRKELDLRIEAAATSTLKENLQNNHNVYVPKIHWSHTTRQILTVEWINGINIKEHDKVSKIIDPKSLAQNMINCFLDQAYRDGFFHADLHHGNILVDNKGRIIFIDCGIMGFLNDDDRIYVAEILRGFVTRDYKYVAELHFSAGYVNKEQSIQDFTLACRAIGEPIMGLPGDQISIAKLLALLFKITKDFDMHTQTQLILLQKNLVLIEGICQQLHPQINLWNEAEQWIEKWAKENFSCQSKLKRSLKEASSMIHSLPQKLTMLDEIITHHHNKITTQNHQNNSKSSACMISGVVLICLGISIIVGAPL